MRLPGTLRPVLLGFVILAVPLLCGASESGCGASEVPLGSNVPGEGEFACGDVVCTIATQYCYEIPGDGNVPTKYQCSELPAECPSSNATCDCIPRIGCETNPCTGNASTGLHYFGCF